MIVCALDDLLFSVKISTAAKGLGADVYFERSADRLLQTVREKRPSLVIFDLNSARLKPMEAIAAIKGDAALRSIPTLGFVSHVHADVIREAVIVMRASAPKAPIRQASKDKAAR